MVPQKQQLIFRNGFTCGVGFPIRENTELPVAVGSSTVLDGRKLWTGDREGYSRFEIGIEGFNRVRSLEAMKMHPGGAERTCDLPQRRQSEISSHTSMGEAIRNLSKYPTAFLEPYHRLAVQRKRSQKRNMYCGLLLHRRNLGVFQRCSGTA